MEVVGNLLLGMLVLGETRLVTLKTQKPAMLTKQQPPIGETRSPTIGASGGVRQAMIVGTTTRTTTTMMAVSRTRVRGTAILGSNNLLSRSAKQK